MTARRAIRGVLLFVAFAVAVFVIWEGAKAIGGIRGGSVRAPMRSSTVRRSAGRS